MYKKILIPLENSAADKAILEHIRPLAKMTRASLLLMHVADGWVARNYEQLKLAESEEMKTDRAYLESVALTLRDEGFEVSHVLAMGEPSDEIVKFSQMHKVDLIAMSTHGHRFISDLLYGSTADKVRHLVDVPVLLLKAKPAKEN
jgi:nucleotide-binding universal stress UspA family protein